MTSTPFRSAVGFGPGVRIGDAEREAAVTELSRHFAEGRLTSVEHDERTTLALGARTQAELDALLADLPRADLPNSRRAGYPFAHPFARSSRAVGLIGWAGVAALFGLLAFVGLVALAALLPVPPILALLGLLFLVRRVGFGCGRRPNSRYLRSRGYRAYARPPGEWT